MQIVSQCSIILYRVLDYDESFLVEAEAVQSSLVQPHGICLHLQRYVWKIFTVTADVMISWLECLVI